MNVWLLVAGLLFGVMVAGCGEEDTAGCDAASLGAELAAAGPGDTVSLGACRIVGSFTVPEGVTLRGVGSDTVLVASDDVGVELVLGSAGETALRDVTVETSGRVGVLAVGDGAVRVANVTVTADRGYALGVDGASAVVLDTVTLVGPVTEANRESTDLVTPSSTTTATYGLVFLDVDTADLSDVVITGFGFFGATVLDRTSDGAMTAGTALSWNGGGVTDTLGVGLYVSGGTADLTDLELSRTWRGLRGVASYAGIFTQDARVTTSGLVVEDNENYGLLHDGGGVTHSLPAVQRNGLGGILGDTVDGFTLTSGTTADNGAVGLFLLDSTNVAIRDTTVDRTALTPSNLRAGALGDSIMLGDGIVFVGTTGGVALDNVTATDNERVGMIVDLDGGWPTFAGVQVSGTGAQLGLVGGSTDDPTMPTQMLPVAPDGMWDAGVTRLGATVANDVAALSAMDIAGIVTPAMLPSPSDAAGIVTPSM